MLKAPSIINLRSVFADGVATARQLMAAGVPERTIYFRCLEGGPWQRPLPGIIFLFTGRPTRRQYVLAALLLGGPDAVVTGIEAVRYHGMRRGPARRPETVDPQEQVHILIPHRRQVRSVGFVHVERTTNMPKPVHRDGIPVAPVPRACIDAARRLTRHGEITELLSDAVQRHLCTVAHLAQEIGACSRRGTAIANRVLKDVSDGVRSAAERGSKQLWSRSGLPPAQWNVAVYDAEGKFVGIADCWVDEVAMVWETESTEWHLDPAAHDYTVERATTFTAAGAVYVATKPKRILEDPEGVAKRLRAVYATAAKRPRPLLRTGPHT